MTQKLCSLCLLLALTGCPDAANNAPVTGPKGSLPGAGPAVAGEPGAAQSNPARTAGATPSGSAAGGSPAVAGDTPRAVPQAPTDAPAQPQPHLTPPPPLS